MDPDPGSLKWTDFGVFRGIRWVGNRVENDSKGEMRGDSGWDGLERAQLVESTHICTRVIVVYVHRIYRYG